MTGETEMGLQGLELSILYRGPLRSCNYACPYCPFAKHKETRQEHTTDRAALERFVAWVGERQGDRISVLFTPWGEALVRKRYQKALEHLSHMPNVRRVAIQTNLSGRLEWVAECDKSRLALWATYHPSQSSRARFLAKCYELERRGVRYSVGVVGMKAHAGEIEALRQELPEHVYLWINAYKARPHYYSEAEVNFMEAIDPLFPVNLEDHASRGRACRAGHTVISVDGDGTIRRCHFIHRAIGNIYEQGWEEALRPRSCANQTCDCHIGYVHLEELRLSEVFGDGVLERVPARKIW
jgi:MoaA/NifB/PqqE/SkfB family radical SAM enzyme